MSEPLERFWVQIPFKFPTIQNFIGVIIVLYLKPHADQARAHIVHKTKKEYDTTACKKKTTTVANAGSGHLFHFTLLTVLHDTCRYTCMM